ncbi:hypothetical protein FACS18942_10390 [Planctomycetales bacterium]|nr:hypothetical protein FACS18942_10390 [Planctomycetales bacterium]
MWKHCPKCRCYYSGKCPYCHTDSIETEITEPPRFVQLEPEYDDEDESGSDLFDTHSQLSEQGFL